MPHINLNMRLFDALPMNREYQPSGATREKWDVEDNQSPSIRDGVFQDERELKIAQAKTKKEAEASLTIKIKNVEEVALLADKCGRMVLSREALGDHIEERIHAFLMQIIDCYDTDKYFTVGKTQDQTKSTSAIHFKLEKGVPLPLHADLKMELASAHHGTLPCIFAYPRNEWEAWKANNNPKSPGKPGASVYLNKSDTYYLNNACTGLAKVINQADIDLDGNPTEETVEFGVKKKESQKKLREFTVELLNQAARKEITPVQGLELFMAKLTTLVDKIKQENPEGEKHQIFSAWQEDLQALNMKYEGNYKLFIAQLLGIHIPAQDRDSINLEELIYPRYFEILKRKNLYKTQLSYNIDQLKSKILENVNKKPKSFDKAFKLALMEESLHQSEKVRTIFQRYFNCSGQTQNALKTECQLTCGPALKLVNSEDSRQKIKTFFQSFSQYIHNFTIEESKFSSQLVSQIRKAQGISLRKFAEKFNKQFPQAPRLNHEQLRRIELGCVQPSPIMVQHLAAVLNIQESLLMTKLS